MRGVAEQWEMGGLSQNLSEPSDSPLVPAPAPAPAMAQAPCSPNPSPAPAFDNKAGQVPGEGPEGSFSLSPPLHGLEPWAGLSVLRLLNTQPVLQPPKIR